MGSFNKLTFRLLRMGMMAGLFRCHTHEAGIWNSLTFMCNMRNIGHVNKLVSIFPPLDLEAGKKLQNFPSF